MSTIEDGQKFIEHYGTKGMKWGVRKRRNERDRAKTFGGSGKKAPKPDPLKNISDQELQKIVQRMNMEQQYRRLSSPQPAPSPVKKILAAGATMNAVAAFAKSPAGKALGSALALGAVGAVSTSRAVGSIGRTEVLRRP